MYAHKMKGNSLGESWNVSRTSSQLRPGRLDIRNECKEALFARARTPETKEADASTPSTGPPVTRCVPVRATLTGRPERTPRGKTTNTKMLHRTDRDLGH